MPLILITLYPSEEVFCTTQRSNHAECVAILELAETFELEQTLLGCVCVCVCVHVCVVCVCVCVRVCVCVCGCKQQRPTQSTRTDCTLVVTRKAKPRKHISCTNNRAAKDHNLQWASVQVHMHKLAYIRMYVRTSSSTTFMMASRALLVWCS